MLPPWLVRRAVLAPLVFLLVFLAVTTFPLWVIAAAAVTPSLPGRLRPLRMLWFLLVFLAVEAVTLTWLFGLWVACGFGRRLGAERWQAAHYRVLGWYVGRLLRSARRTFNVVVDVATPAVWAWAPGLGRPEPVTAVDRTDRHPAPLIVFSRHAGPGDSFLLVQEVLRLGLRPRIVLKDTLRWIPAIDVGLGRLPSHFVAPGQPRGTGTAAVERLAADLSPGDALVLFPEGRNYTPHRRRTSIAKLEQLGDHEAAEQAREMRYVLTPRTGGVLAALRAAPHADVAFVAHTGLEDLSTVVDLWRGLPMDARVQVEMWHVPAADVPDGDAARAAWLLGWWRRIDAWLMARYGEVAVPDAVVDVVLEGEEADPAERQVDEVG